MRFLSRVVWSEGMHLGPQHFQTQSRYFEDSLWFLSASLRNHPWGLMGLALDTEAVRNGTATVRFASGILPDGLIFELPDSDAAPRPLDLRQIFAAADSAIVLHLAVPARRNGGADTALVDPDSANATGPARYRAVERVLRDETISSDEYTVPLARKNLRLCSEAELAPGEVSLPVARILRDGRGGFMTDPNFLPPMLRIGASEELLTELKRLADSIEDRIATTRRGRKRGGQWEMGSSALDVSNYWFLHALCSAMPRLRNALSTRDVHPEDMYCMLAELAGSLCTFSLESTPASLPAYNHLDLRETFNGLYRHIFEHLETVSATNTVSLEFQQAGQLVHAAQVDDERCLRRSRWILGVRSDIAESAVMRLTPQLVKVCSAEGVVKLVQRALPGLELMHLPVPPAAIAAQADMQYFSVGQSGPCWQHILATKKVGIYVPSELGRAVFGLTVVLEGTA